MSKFVGRNGLSNLGRATGLGERKKKLFLKT